MAFVGFDGDALCISVLFIQAENTTIRHTPNRTRYTPLGFFFLYCGPFALMFRVQVPCSRSLVRQLCPG
jgi:hypothetical protein